MCGSGVACVGVGNGKCMAYIGVTGGGGNAGNNGACGVPRKRNEDKQAARTREVRSGTDRTLPQRSLEGQRRFEGRPPAYAAPAPRAKGSSGSVTRCAGTIKPDREMREPAERMWQEAGAARSRVELWGGGGVVGSQ